MTTTSFTAGNITLTGWVSDFVASSGSSSDQMILPLGTVGSPSTGSFVFEWPTNTSTGNNFPTPGTDSPQQIGIVETAGSTDLVSLTLTFTTTDPNVGIYNSTGVTELLAANGSTLTLGGSAGESAAQLISDLRGLQMVDASKFNFSTIDFKLTDVTDGDLSKSFSEAFVTPCYAPGTMITTPAGEVAVEDLQIGDLVATASGALKPVKWIGRRGYTAATAAEFPNVRPVLIQQDALAPGLPHRDLMVSPMHALFIDGAFIPAAALVNGVSILRQETAGPVDYIHIELEAHDAIFAEGTPAETFVDDNSRAMFDNVLRAHYDLHGTTGSPAGFSAPRLEDGYRLEALRCRFAARAGVAAPAAVSGELAGHVERLQDGVLEGWVIDQANPTVPVELQVLVDGELVATLLANRYRADLDRAGLAGGRCAFTLALAATDQVEVRRAGDGRQVPMPQPVRQPALAY